MGACTLSSDAIRPLAGQFPACATGDDNPIAAFPFGLVDRQIRLTHQHLIGASILRKACHPDAEGGTNGPTSAADLKACLLEFISQALGDALSACAIGICQQDDELFATEPRPDITAADIAPDDIGDARAVSKSL